jgi:hypothetical protein
MRAHPVRLPLVFVVLSVALAACGTPAPPAPNAPSADGATYVLDLAAPDAIAVGLVMAAPGAFPADVSAAELIQIAPDVFAGEFVLVEDGAFSVRLPDAADVPAATLVPLADAVLNFESCTVDASPLAAEASLTLFEGVTIPGLMALTTMGTALMIASDVELDGGLMAFEGTLYGWIYVDRDAHLSTSGCAYEADLTLAEGWNQLAWTQDEAGFTVEVVEATDVFAAVAVPFPTPVMIVSLDGDRSAPEEVAP